MIVGGLLLLIVGAIRSRLPLIDAIAWISSLAMIAGVVLIIIGIVQALT